MTSLMHDMVRAMLLFNEVGVGVKIHGASVSFVFGVRTMWSNDDDVVARLVAMSPDDIMNGKGAQDAKSFAKGPLADDIKAGAPGSWRRSRWSACSPRSRSPRSWIT